MNYKRIYDNLISSRKKLNREKGKGIYYEKHHILPKCLGGKDEKENLVLLTAKEHFVSHLLLTKITTGNERNKMIQALWLLSRSKQNKPKKIVSARQYSYIKEIAIAAIKENKIGKTTRFNYKHSDETKKKIGLGNKGKVISDSVKQLWSIQRKGIKKSEETKRKMSENGKGFIPWNKGKVVKEKLKCPHCEKLISYNAKNYHFENCTKLTGIKRIGFSLGVKRKKVKCTHCEKEGATNVMYRFHFENCKNK